MKKIIDVLNVFALSATLSAATPAFSQTQPVERGYDGDQPVKSGQRDTEDHETTFDWVGFFGLFGLVGLLGPKRREIRRSTVVRNMAIATTVLATGAALSIGTPALSQGQDEGKGYNSIEATQPNNDGDDNISIGWIGLLGLAGLLGLRRGKGDTNRGDNPQSIRR